MVFSVSCTHFMIYLLLFFVLIQKCFAEASSPDDFQCSYEFNRNKEQHSNMMKCAHNTVCISSLMVCNGVDDCEDESDETNCDVDPEDRELQSNRILCKRDEYRCPDQSGKCILIEQTCDGNVDCPAGADEDREKCRACTKKSCGYKCRIADYEGQCYCPDGSTLNDDDRTCSPVDFCQTDGGRRCQQYCNGDATGYHCSCAENYFLAEDGHGCHVKKKKDIQFIITAGDKQIITVPLFNDSGHSDIYFEHKLMRPDPEYVFFKDDPHYPKQFPHEMGYRRSIAYNNRKYTAFLTANQFRQHADLIAVINNTEKVLRRDVVGPVYIAVDHVGGNFFYTQTYHSEPGIYVCAEDALFCRKVVAGKDVVPYDYKHFHEKVLENGTRKLTAYSKTRLFISGKKRQYYAGIALNPFTGKLIWIDMYADCRLMMSNMDGSDIEELFNNSDEILHGITIDPIKNEIYFSNWFGMTISRMNLNTMEQHTVVSYGVGPAMQLTYFDGYLYWVEWYWKTLRKAHVRNKSCTGEILRYFDETPAEMAIKHPYYQPMPSVNPCAEIVKSCPWICVVVPGSEPGTVEGKCLCPYNYREEKGTCIHDKTLTVKKHIHLMEAHSYVDAEYWKELCSTGTACFNGGKCAVIRGNDTTGMTYCNCPAPFIGERCELADPRLSSGWTVFWAFSFFMFISIAGFGFLYSRNERVRELTRSAMHRLTRRNGLSETRITLDATESQPPNAPPVSFASPLFSS